MERDGGVHGGVLVAEALARRGVRVLFTLCGGHISPVLVACKQAGIRVVDVRGEATAVFAADAVSRLGGVPGVAAVTAGPGLTNTVTAVKNAQLAQSPVVLLGGATATILKGRGALQDIDQLALMTPHVKWAASVRRVREIGPALERAFGAAQSGLPGPVFVEIPVDLLYPEPLVRQWYGVGPAGKSRGLKGALVSWYLGRHLHRLFAGAGERPPAPPPAVSAPRVPGGAARKAAAWLERARRPLLLIGSQATAGVQEIEAVRRAVESLGVPVYLTGMARGLLGRQHPLQLRHRRKQALAEADLVVLAGLPADFRLSYGRDIPSSAALVSVNRSTTDLKRNRRPDLAVPGDPGAFLRALAGALALADARPPDGQRWPAWLRALRERDEEREREIDADAESGPEAESGAGAEPGARGVNPVRLCRRLDEAIAEDGVVVGDGGDFVATASYIVRPRGPLAWLDPGPFGTLGSGAGFALGAKLCRPQSEVWLLYGDGSVGYSLSEWDTFVRHEVPVIAVVGNDASWRQIAREQVEIFGDDVATALRHASYHEAARGLGAEGLLIESDEQIAPCLQRAKALAREGRPVLVNAICRRTAFRKGSISM